MRVAAFVLILLISCNSKNRQNDLDLKGYETKKRPTIDRKATNERDFTYQVISAPANTFGYHIFSNQKLLIHQSTIPGLPGTKGFATKAAAKKVAELVISKLKKGEMPPTVSSHELKKLNVIE